MKAKEENNKKEKDNIDNLKRTNSHQIIINSEIDLNLNEDSKIHSKKLTENNDFNKEAILKKYSKEIINDIEVIGIKINKNDHHINIKNDNKRYQKFNERPVQSKLFQIGKNTNVIRKNKIETKTNIKLFYIEKSNNVLNNLKHNQPKSKQINKNKIFSAQKKLILKIGAYSRFHIAKQLIQEKTLNWINKKQEKIHLII